MMWKRNENGGKEEDTRWNYVAASMWQKSLVITVFSFLMMMIKIKIKIKIMMMIKRSCVNVTKRAWSSRFSLLIHFDAEWWKEFISPLSMVVPTLSRPSQDIIATHLVILTPAMHAHNLRFIVKIHVFLLVVISSLEQKLLSSTWMMICTHVCLECEEFFNRKKYVDIFLTGPPWKRKV